MTPMSTLKELYTVRPKTLGFWDLNSLINSLAVAILADFET